MTTNQVNLTDNKPFRIEKVQADNSLKVVSSFETAAARDRAWRENVVGRSDAYLFRTRDGKVEVE
jgi:hypothetical protein